MVKWTFCYLVVCKYFATCLFGTQTWLDHFCGYRPALDKGYSYRGSRSENSRVTSLCCSLPLSEPADLSVRCREKFCPVWLVLLCWLDLKTFNVILKFHQICDDFDYRKTSRLQKIFIVDFVKYGRYQSSGTGSLWELNVLCDSSPTFLVTTRLTSRLTLTWMGEPRKQVLTNILDTFVDRAQTIHTISKQLVNNTLR